MSGLGATGSFDWTVDDVFLPAMRRLVEAGLSLFSATRHLERIADHATNIAEDVIYLVEGEIVRHRPAAVSREK